MITVYNLLQEMGHKFPNKNLKNTAGKKIAEIYRSKGKKSKPVEQYENGFRFDVAAYPNTFKKTMEDAITSVLNAPHVVKSKIRKAQKGNCAHCGTPLSKTKKTWHVVEGKAIHFNCPKLLTPEEKVKRWNGVLKGLKNKETPTPQELKQIADIEDLILKTKPLEIKPVRKLVTKPSHKPEKLYSAKP